MGDLIGYGPVSVRTGSHHEYSCGMSTGVNNVKLKVLCEYSAIIKAAGPL